MPKILPGEILYLNLPYHPGNQLDKQPPTPPQRVTVRRGENMGYPGVEVSWKLGSDDHWLSHYLIYRDGQLIDKVAKGTFYFDHSLGADIAVEYAIASVDGSGNKSSVAKAPTESADRLDIYDDSNDAINFTGSWKRERDDYWADGKTMTSSNKAGDTLQFQFTGRRMIWFTKLGPECGVARIEVDGRESTVDTYSADEMWGIAVWAQDFDSPGLHTVKLTVAGQRAEHPSDVHPGGDATWVHVDGFRMKK